MNNSSKQRTILLVDDSAVFIEFEKNILGRHGHHLLQANNGREALRIAREKHPDLIMLDINMPVMNGFEFLVVAKQDNRIADIPVIVVTSKGRQSDVKYALELGADDYITKPIDNILLVLKVNNMLSFERKRDTPRKPIELPATVTSDNLTLSGTILDLSSGGVLLQLAQSLNTGEKIELEFNVPFAAGHRPIHVVGKVRGVRHGETKDGFHHHIQFINLNRQDLFFIETVVNSDIKSLASFLISSPRQRKEEPVKLSMESPLIKELNRLLDDLFEIEQAKKQLLDQYQQLKTQLRDVQLEYQHKLEYNSRLEQDYLTLTNYFISLHRLYSQTNQEDFLALTGDILHDLIGAKQYDVFLHKGDEKEWKSLFKGASCEPIIFDAAIEGALADKGIYLFDKTLFDSSAKPAGYYAVVPLPQQENVSGLITITQLLPQISYLSVAAVKLLEILSTHFLPALALAMNRRKCDDIIEQEFF